MFNRAKQNGVLNDLQRERESLVGQIREKQIRRKEIIASAANAEDPLSREFFRGEYELAGMEERDLMNSYRNVSRILNAYREKARLDEEIVLGEKLHKQSCRNDLARLRAKRDAVNNALEDDLSYNEVCAGASDFDLQLKAYKIEHA